MIKIYYSIFPYVLTDSVAAAIHESEARVIILDIERVRSSLQFKIRLPELVVFTTTVQGDNIFSP